MSKKTGHNTGMVRRLTNDKKAGIVAEFVRGEAKGCAPTVVSLARAFGVSRPTIYTVLEEAGIVFPRPRRNGPALSNSDGACGAPLSETVGAHAELMVPGGGVANRDRVIELARKGLNPTQIAREIGIARQNVYLHLPEELRPRAVKRNEAVMQPLSETIGAHASPMVPEAAPGQQEAAENAANQS